VPHQSRHTLATNLLRAGASLTHIRRYLGQVSDGMAEHYVHLSNSDLEDVLQQVWVAEHGTTDPGELLTSDTSPMTREQAQVLAIDLSRRSTPPAPSTASKVHWPASGSWSMPSPWICAKPRTTSVAYGPPGSAPPILPLPPAPPTTKAAGKPTTNRKSAHERALPICDAHRRGIGDTAPQHPSRARPCPRHHRSAAPGKAPITAAVVARRAGVSRTFLYTNPDAKTAVAEAIRQTGNQQHRLAVETDNARKSTWRERALNAEDALKTAHTEILFQRNRIRELLGQIRDLEAEWTRDDVQRISTENTTLKQRVRQLIADDRTLDERLKAARSNLRFQDRRIADLEARLTEPSNPTASTCRS
jgi:hypothetical protein